MTAKDFWGCTSVHYCKMKNVLKLLISKDASVLTKNYAGLTPLQFYLKKVPIQDQDAKYLWYLREAEEAEIKRLRPEDLAEFREIADELFKNANVTIEASDAQMTSRPMVSAKSSQSLARPVGSLIASNYRSSVSQSGKTLLQIKR